MAPTFVTCSPGFEHFYGLIGAQGAGETRRTPVSGSILLSFSLLSSMFLFGFLVFIVRVRRSSGFLLRLLNGGRCCACAQARSTGSARLLLCSLKLESPPFNFEAANLNPKLAPSETTARVGTRAVYLTLALALASLREKSI